MGILAFSEGALAATMLCWQQQLGRIPWLPKLRFATLICCFYSNEAGTHMLSEAAARESDRAFIDIPTLHLHGRQDFCLPRARKLVAQHYKSEFAEVMEFEGGHQVPSRQEDCAKAIDHILSLS